MCVNEVGKVERKVEKRNNHITKYCDWLFIENWKANAKQDDEKAPNPRKTEYANRTGYWEASCGSLFSHFSIGTEGFEDWLKNDCEYVPNRRWVYFHILVHLLCPRLLSLYYFSAAAFSISCDSLFIFLPLIVIFVAVVDFTRSFLFFFVFFARCRFFFFRWPLVRCSPLRPSVESRTFAGENFQSATMDDLIDKFMEEKCTHAHRAEKCALLRSDRV